jgi:hypothetical protein
VGGGNNTGFQIRAAKVVLFWSVFFFFFPLYIANRILQIYLDPRGTSFACLLAWMGLGIKLVPRGSKCEHDRAHLRKRNFNFLGPSVNMNRAHLRKRNLIFLVQV